MNENKEIILASKNMAVEDSRKREFCSDIRIEEITGKELNKDKVNFDLEIAEICKENPYEILDVSDFQDIKRHYIDTIVEGIIAKLPYKRGFLGKKLEKIIRDEVIDDQELEKARTALMQFVDFAQSEKVDELCMIVMRNPYRLSEGRLNNWLDLMIKNSSNQLLANISSIIDSIKIDTNLPEDIRNELKQEKKKIKNEIKKEKGKIAKTVDTAVDVVKEKVWDTVCDKKAKGEKIGIVFNKLPMLYKQMEIPNTPFTINSTLGYVQSILEHVNDFDKYVPDLQNKKEGLIFNVARSVSIDSSKAGSKDAYARIFDLSLKYLREPTTIKDVVETLFKYPDTFTVIDKVKIILDSNNEKSYSPELIRYVAYNFIKLYCSLSEKNQDEKDNIRRIIVAFLLSNTELNIETFDYLEKLIKDTKEITTIITMMVQKGNNRTLNIPAVHKRILEDTENKFDDAQKRLCIMTIFDNFNNLTPEIEAYVFELLISTVCGEFNVSSHLRDEIAEKCCAEDKFNQRERFVKGIVSKCEENESLFNTLPDSIRDFILNSKNISDDKKTTTLLQMIRQAKTGECNSAYKEKAKSNIITYMLSLSSDSEKTRFLENILNDYLGINE